MSSEENSAAQMENFNKMKVADIKKLLKSQGLSTQGNKSELIQRLKSTNDTASSDSFLETSGVVDSEVFDEDLEEDLDEAELMSDEKEEVGHQSNTADKSQADADPSQPTDTAASSNKQKGGTKGKEKLSEDDEEEEMMEEDEEGKNAMSGGEGAESQQPPQSPNIKDNGGGGGSGNQQENSKKTETPCEDNKEASQHKTTAAPATPSDNPQNIIKLTDLSAREKLAKRAEKFGLTEAAKKEMRAARFGIQTPASMTELLKKRAERFGLPASAITSTKVSLVTNESDVLKKRAQRFGIVSSPTTGGKVEKKSASAVSATVKLGGGAKKANNVSLSTSERRLMRSVRFKVAT